MVTQHLSGQVLVLQRACCLCCSGGANPPGPGVGTWLLAPQGWGSPGLVATALGLASAMS